MNLYRNEGSGLPARSDDFSEFKTKSTRDIKNPVRQKRQSMMREQRRALRARAENDELYESFMGSMSKPTSGIILGRRRDELPDVAVSNKVRKPRPGQIYLTLRKEIFDILSKRYPVNSVIDVDGTDYGVAYLALNYLILQFLKAANNEKLDMIVARPHIWMILDAILPTDRHDKSGCYSYRMDVNPLVNGAGGLFATKAPVYAGGLGLGWPTGAVLSGQNVLVAEASVPALSNEQIVYYGEQAWTDMMNFMAGKGISVVSQPVAGEEHDHYRKSVGAFALATSTGGYSVLDSDNSPALWGSTLGLGVDAAIEVALHPYEEWLARLGLCEEEPDESPIHRYVGMNGLLDYGDVLYNELQGRQPGARRSRPVFYQLEGFLNQLLIQIVQGDVNRMLDSGAIGPFSDLPPFDMFTQKGSSVILTQGENDLLHGAILAILNTISQTAYVTCDVLPNSWERPIGAGTSMVGDFSSLETSFPTQLVETIRSSLPVGRTELEHDVHVDSDGNEFTVTHMTNYYPCFVQTGQVNLNILNSPDPVAEAYVKLLYPQMNSLMYDFGPSLTSLPPVWMGAFDATKQYFGTDSYLTAIQGVQTLLSNLKAYILMQVLSSGENDAQNTLMYYQYFGSSENPPAIGIQHYFDYDVRAIVNRDSINRKHIGWDLAHVCSAFVPDPNAPVELAIDLGWLQNYYGATFRLQRTKGFSCIEHDVQAALNYVKERGGQGASELGELDRVIIAQGLGGGQSTFTRTMGKIIPVGANVLKNLALGALDGAVSSGLSQLGNLFSTSSIMKSMEREPYRVPFHVRHYVRALRSRQDQDDCE
jgi:hypothetical protein